MRRRNSVVVIWLLGIGYFAFYIPYAGLVKVLSEGLWPGLDPISGLEMLPSVVLGTVAGMPLFLALSGWWRHARRRELPGGVRVPWPGAETVASGFWTALIIGTTTLNFTFAGVSILFMLLLMRAGTLVLSPVVDALHRHPVRWYAWVALALSLAAAATALVDVESYSLSIAAATSLAVYLVGYAGRFVTMKRWAKHPDAEINRRFFVEEHMLAGPILVLLLAAVALLGPLLAAPLAGFGEELLGLRHGFANVLATPASRLAFLAGLLYEGLFISGTLIYLDRREFTYCVPVNRASSLVAGVVASFLLAGLFGHPTPSSAQLVAMALVLAAIVFLVAPPLAEQRSLSALDRGLRRLFLFVCSGNRIRSPMAAAICNQEIARRLGISWSEVHGAPVRAESAGTAAHAGLPMPAWARTTLRRLGVPAMRHGSRPLSVELIERADVIFCLAPELCPQVLALAPGAAAKVLCLDPEGWGVEEPEDLTPAASLRWAQRLRDLVRQRLDEAGPALAPRAAR